MILALFLLLTSTMTALTFIRLAVGIPAAFDAGLLSTFCLGFLLSTVLVHRAMHRGPSRATVVRHVHAERR